MPARSRLVLIGAGVVAAAAIALGIAWLVQTSRLQARLLTTDPDRIAASPELVSYAASLARPAYAHNCASCHGAKMQGDQAKGAPNLRDQTWLYDAGGIGDLERTILYGIRSGLGKSRNITDMPAMGRTLQLSPTEIHDVEIYVLSLTRPETDIGAVQRGSAIFQTKGSCYDCHSSDAQGNPDYGAPNLTDNDWLYGGDPRAVYSSIYDGRHGVCPAWIGKLKPAVIRALAVYIHTVSQPKPTLRKGAVHG